MQVILARGARAFVNLEHAPEHVNDFASPLNIYLLSRM